MGFISQLRSPRGKETLVTSRREFLQKAGLGFGSLAASFLMSRDGAATQPATASPFAAGMTHVPATATNGGLRIIGVIRDGKNETASVTTPNILVRWSSPTSTLYGYQTAV